jgi:hypothetical protein
VQFRESIPWLRRNQYRDIGALGCVYHVLKKFSERTGCAGSARLLSVDIVHGGVPASCQRMALRLCKRKSLHPHAKGEAVVYP